MASAGTAVGTKENGIELTGCRDKFLALKWDPVPDATSYAVFKEVRDIWDMQTVTEVCKETLGALRPGNKYLIKILALDASGARLATLGTATFVTDGPEDKRQPKIKLDALEAHWAELVKGYPEPAAKADPYSGATPCPYTWTCTLMSHAGHCQTYGHPRPLACPNGEGCSLNSKEHQAQFSH